jgi:hypothetical protein
MSTAKPVVAPWTPSTQVRALSGARLQIQARLMPSVSAGKTP